MQKKVLFGQRPVGPAYKALIVAEIGGNHGGDPDLAKKMIKAAAEVKIEAVKFQAYRSANFLSPQSPYYNDLAAEELKFEDLEDLLAYAKSLNLLTGLTVFDAEGLRLAEDSAADFIKISSGDLTYGSLLSLAAQGHLPLVISTGASYAREVEAALKQVQAARDRLVLLQCASLYPAPLESANLRVMKNWLAEGLLAGYSDHTIGPEASLAALSLGAVLLEKHFTINRGLAGGDNSMSAEVEEILALLKEAERQSNCEPGLNKVIKPALLGAGVKEPHKDELPMRGIIRRVVLAAKDLRAGQKLLDSDIAIKRPPELATDALAPDEAPRLLGQKLRRKLKAGSPILASDIE